MASGWFLIVILVSLLSGSTANALPVSAQQLSAVLAAMLRSGAGQNGGSGAAAATGAAAYGSAAGGGSAPTPGEGVVAHHGASDAAQYMARYSGSNSFAVVCVCSRLGLFLYKCCSCHAQAPVMQ